MTLVWAPNPGPQHALIECPLPEVFFGGARGGGKTDGLLGKWSIKADQLGSAFNAMWFRRTTVSSSDAIDRAREIYEPLGAKFNATRTTFKFPNGARIGFGYLDNDEDAKQYQGRNLSDAAVDEAGQYPDPGPIDKLFGVLRSASGAPIQLTLMANPGGPGQHWIRERYKLHPFPSKPMVITRKIDRGDGTFYEHHMAVIPSRITDNPVLLDNDPGYQDRLRLVGSAALVRAWLDGDWSAVEGAFFDQWDPGRHVVPFFVPPADWGRIRSGDWGYAKPFSVGWWAVVSDDYRLPDGRLMPRGAMYRYREWYGATKPNTGLRLTAEAVADGVREREEGETIQSAVMDPAAFAEDGGPSIAERMIRRGVLWRPADNKRVTVAGKNAGAMGGWDMMRARLAGREDAPMLFVSETCRDFIRTVPVLQHDPKRAEDLDTEAEDHVADEARYACMSRPWVPTKEAQETRDDDYSLYDEEDEGSWRTT